MNPSEPWHINSNDRITAVGKTGSGKTEAVKELVWRSLKDVIFIDPKRQEYKDLNVPVLKSLDAVHEALFPDDEAEHLTRFCYVPEQPTPEVFDKVCRWAFEHRNIHVLADEIKAIYNGASITQGHELILTQGRAVGVGMSNLTQRPKRVPLETLSEAEHHFVFQLKLKDDRDRMKSILGEKAGQARKLDPYHFIYDHDRLDEPQMCEPLPIK